MRWVVLPEGGSDTTQRQFAEVLAVHAALLHTGQSGQILYFGGDEHDPVQHDRNQIDHTRIFDCATGNVMPAASPTTDVFCCGHAMLGDGRLLVAGGTQDFDVDPDPAGDPFGHVGRHHYRGSRDAWIFDPTTAVWIRAASMNLEPGRNAGGGRWYPTLLTLANGQVLAMSGHPDRDDTRHDNNSPETFSLTPPAQGGAWTLLGPDDPQHMMATWYPRLHVLPGGDVLCSTAVGPNRRTQRFNPSANSWVDVCNGPPDIIDGWIYNGYWSTSVVLPLLPQEDYRVRILTCGGSQPLVLDLGANPPNWQPTSPRTLPGAPVRAHVNSVLLPTGEVFICGGVEPTPDSQGNWIPLDRDHVLAAELYQAAADRWVTLPAATVVRNYHSVALLMPDGRVWVAGSDHNGGRGIANRELRIELFEPWYFGRPDRPRITATPAAVRCGESFDIHTDQAGVISSAAVVRVGSVTHGFNVDQRYIGLEFNRTGRDQLSVTAPPDASIAPPGYYLLFVLNQGGVPSVGKFLRIDSPPALGSVVTAEGRVALLRVHDVGTGYGPPNDSIDVEAVIWLDSQPGKAFGFQLRNDSNRPARQGMLDILRDAFNHNWNVNIDTNIQPGKSNGVITRIWLTK